MNPMDMNRGGEAAGGTKRPPDLDQDMPLTPRGRDRRGEGGLFGGYDGPDRRSGLDRRQAG